MKWRPVEDLLANGGVVSGGGQMWLVKTNGKECGDNHFHLVPAPMLLHWLKPEMIRGRVLYAALVTDPDQR